MVASISELDMVRRHIAEREQHIAYQHVMIARLKSMGASTELAVDLLIQSEKILGMHRKHLSRLRHSQSDDDGLKHTDRAMMVGA